jgi:hypothetical protein
MAKNEGETVVVYEQYEYKAALQITTTSKGSSDAGEEIVSEGGMRITSKLLDGAERRGAGERGFHRAIAGSFGQWQARQARLCRLQMMAANVSNSVLCMWCSCSRENNKLLQVEHIPLSWEQ